MNGRLQFIFVGLFFALMIAFAGANAYVNLQTLRTSSYSGWTAKPEHGRLFVDSVDAEGTAAASLRVSDEILELKGSQDSGKIQAAHSLWRVRPEFSYVAIVRRNGATQEFTLRTTVVSKGEWLNAILSSIIIPLAFIATGLAVFLFKPGDKHALMFALMFSMAIPVPPFALGVLAGFPAWMMVIWIVGYITTALIFPLSFHLLLMFPTPPPVVRRLPVLTSLLYLPFLLTSLPARAMESYLAVVSPEQLLEALADQIAILYENLRLKQSVRRERKIKHEVLARFEEQQINLLRECPACGLCFDSSLQFCLQDGSELIYLCPSSARSRRGLA